jgi:tetratricopeptide (TPR) repeat protein
MDIIGFEKIAPHLANPLVLVGFVLMLAYGIHWQLMKSGLLTQANQKDSGVIIRLFLRYGFWLALAMLLAGFLLHFSGIGLSAWTSWMEKEKVIAVDAGKLARELVGPLQGQLEAKDQQIKALTEAITALSKTGAPAASINEALQELEQGHTAQAQAIFAEVLKTKEAEGKQANKEAAAAARHLGALAFMNDTKAALAAYQKAVQLDPDNADGWNRLASLLWRTGELAQAEEAYRKVLALAEAHQDKEWQAKAIGNLGIVAYTRGELDKAEEMYGKGLALNEALGRKEGMARDYGNLGNVYMTRGELDKAEEMHRKSLEISEALGHKEYMAANYGNLGLVYDTRGELDKAEEMHRKALALHEALGSKEGMAQNYGNLGSVYWTRGELDKAEEMHRKALALHEALGSKEGMAQNYGNLGIVYAKRGNLAQAEAAWKQSLSLYQEMGAMQHPNAKEVQQWLDELAQHRTSQPAPPAASPRR